MILPAQIKQSVTIQLQTQLQFEDRDSTDKVAEKSLGSMLYPVSVIQCNVKWSHSGSGIFKWLQYKDLKILHTNKMQSMCVCVCQMDRNKIETKC